MNLLLRIVSGAILSAAIFAALWVGSAPVAAVIALAVVIACWELSQLAAKTGIRPLPWLLYPLALWLALQFQLPAPYGDLQWPLLAAVVAGLLVAMALRTPLNRWAMAVGGALYLGLSLGYYIALYRWHTTDASHLGLRLVGLVVLTVIVSDTAAYFVGSAIGRHGFFPWISPHKTLEGALAGAAAAILLGAFAGAPLVGLTAATGAGMGALIAVAAMGGDLVESAFKREAGVKDSSNLIPGHGGLLDRADSLVLVGPVVYCFLKLVSF
jgi:phosphatidate cytidylyltransferase